MTTETKSLPNRKIGVHEMHAADYQRSDWVARPEKGTTLDEMMTPEYWANQAQNMRQFDRIEVRAFDGSWWAELLVMVVQPFAAKVHVLRHLDFAKPSASGDLAVPDGYEIKWRGPQHRFAIVRLSDNTVITEDHASKQTAAASLDLYLKALA